jgi:hypothetical protein
MDRPVYKITIDPEYSDGEELGISMIAFTSKPAIKVKGMAFSTVKPMIFTDDVKMRIVAPAMIPMQIYRRDEDGIEYDVEFTAEVIESIHGKFMQDLSNKDIFNLEHDAEEKVPAYILEAWIVDNPKSDKAYSTYGIEVPKGTLMLVSQVTDKEYYNSLVESEQIGYSIEGFLGLKMSEILKLNTMKLPDGEHLIEGKIYVVKDGEIIEIKEETKEEMAAEEPETEEVEQEAETTVSDAEEDVQEEEEETAAENVAMAVDPTTDAEAVLAIVAPVIEEQVTQLVAMIADLKNQLEEALMAKAEEEQNVELKKDMKMSSRELFKEFVKFSKLK